MTTTDNERLEHLRPFLEKEGYTHLTVIEGRGICGIFPFIFTTAIVEGINDIGYEGRWCYPKDKIYELMLAYQIWNGKEDPLGPWIKYKGRKEYSNPKLK